MKNIIHIGANKAASTTLQRHLFSKSEDLIYFGEDCEDYADSKKIIDSMISDDEIHFSLKDTKKIFNNKLKTNNKKTFVFSSEDILTSRVPSQCAKRLYEILPNSKILIILRNQIDAIQSWYANHGAYLKQVPKSYWRRYVSFDDWIEYCFEFHKYSPLESFLYHTHLNLYRKHFGMNNIHILLFEDFIYSKPKFISQLSDILEINPSKVNKLLKNKHERPRKTKRQHIYHKIKSQYFHKIKINDSKFISHHFRSLFNRYLHSGDKFTFNINKVWRNKLLKYYLNDNKLLKKNYSIDIEKYNYPLD